MHSKCTCRVALRDDSGLTCCIGNINFLVQHVGFKHHGNCSVMYVIYLSKTAHVATTVSDHALWRWLLIELSSRFQLWELKVSYPLDPRLKSFRLSPLVNF